MLLTARRGGGVRAFCRRSRGDVVGYSCRSGAQDASNTRIMKRARLPRACMIHARTTPFVSRMLFAYRAPTRPCTADPHGPSMTRGAVLPGSSRGMHVATAERKVGRRLAKSPSCSHHGHGRIARQRGALTSEDSSDPIGKWNRDRDELTAALGEPGTWRYRAAGRRRRLWDTRSWVRAGCDRRGR